MKFGKFSRKVNYLRMKEEVHEDKYFTDPLQHWLEGDRYEHAGLIMILHYIFNQNEVLDSGKFLS